MIRWTLFLFLCLLFGNTYGQLREFDNAYDEEFANAYVEHPDLPLGLLEAIAYNKSNFRFLTEAEPESCFGLPRSFGMLGLIENGEGYFVNTLQLVADISGQEFDAIKSNPMIQLSAYADALSEISTEPWDEQGIASRLANLSELPRQTENQTFALELQLYEIMSLLNSSEFMSQFGYESLRLDLENVIGENLAVLSSKRILMDGEHIYNESGETFRAGGGIAPCYDYDADAYVQTPTCNYSSRSGTPVGAVTVHTIQGTYAGAISWAQNCNANVSYHYVVSSTGQITQMLCESDKGWHVGTENPYTIGIEHDGYVSDPNNYTQAMYATTADLVYDITESGYGISALRTAYFPWSATTNYNSSGIPGSCVHIKGHQHFPNQTHTDPGQYWDWDYFYKLINPNTTLNTFTAPSGDFYDNGGQVGVYINDSRTLTLIQPNGANTVTVEFTEFDLENEWDYLYIYDGTDVFSPLIGIYTGTNSPGTVTSNNGHLLFEFRSDCFTTNPGWAASWTSQGTDVTSPTVEVNAENWVTEDFYALYTENDNQGGSNVNNDERFSSVLDFDGTRWSGNADLGFFYDDFSPGLQGWTSQVGTWTLTGGTAIQSDKTESNTNLHISVNQTQFFNYLYTFKMKIDGTGTNRRAGMHFMCSDATQENRGDSYFVYLRADNDKCQIYRVTNDVWQLQADVGLTVDTDTWYDVKVVCNHFNGEIRVYVDGEKIAEWTDPDPLTSGNSVSLRTGNCLVEYDEVRIYKGRIAAQLVEVGNQSDAVRFQNPDPLSPACEIRTYIFDNAGNCSDEDVTQVNVDWTAPIFNGVYDGQGLDIDQTTDGTQLFANWVTATDPHSGVVGYDVAIGTTPGTNDVYGFTNQNLNTNVNVPYALTPSEWYYTTVKAVNAAGLEEADTSNGQEYIDITVAVEELMRQSVYPNPTTGIVNLPQVDNLNWQLLDATGKLVAEGSGARNIDLNRLKRPDQLYLLRLMSKKYETTVRIVHNRDNYP